MDMEEKSAEVIGVFIFLIAASVFVVVFQYLFSVSRCENWIENGRGECKSYWLDSNFVKIDGVWMRYSEYEKTIIAKTGLSQ